jgi:hypothetical protein
VGKLVSKWFVFGIIFSFITLADLAYTEDGTGQADARLPYLELLFAPSHVCEMASSLLFDEAFLSWTFSASSCLIRTIIEVSMPPCLGKNLKKYLN